MLKADNDEVTKGLALDESNDGNQVKKTDLKKTDMKKTDTKKTDSKKTDSKKTYSKSAQDTKENVSKDDVNKANSTPEKAKVTGVRFSCHNSFCDRFIVHTSLITFFYCRRKR